MLALGARGLGTRAPHGMLRSGSGTGRRALHSTMSTATGATSRASRSIASISRPGDNAATARPHERDHAAMRAFSTISWFFLFFFFVIRG